VIGCAQRRSDGASGECLPSKGRMAHSIRG